MDTQGKIIKEFDYWLAVENVLFEFNNVTNKLIESWIEFYADKEEFLTDEEKEEVVEVIKQKLAIKIVDELKPFILLKK